jgi:hypothetical protein
VTPTEITKHMKTHNPENERIKRQYLTYLKEAKRYSDTSLDGVAKALHGFEAYTVIQVFRAHCVSGGPLRLGHASRRYCSRSGGARR